MLNKNGKMQRQARWQALEPGARKRLAMLQQYRDGRTRPEAFKGVSIAAPSSLR